VEPAPSASLPFAVHLTFQDEFDDFSLFDENSFAGRWRTQFGYGGPTAVESRSLVSNGERQAYVDRAFRGVGAATINVDPFRVANGVLTITAEKATPSTKAAIWGLDYTSGMIASRFSFAQRYGYFEMRAALPVGKGLWPAFWLLPIDKSWPPEIDIVEAIGGDHLYFTPIAPASGVSLRATGNWPIPRRFIHLACYGRHNACTGMLTGNRWPRRRPARRCGGRCTFWPIWPWGQMAGQSRRQHAISGADEAGLYPRLAIARRHGARLIAANFVRI
jgi:hypothetical protein